MPLLDCPATWRRVTCSVDIRRGASSGIEHREVTFLNFLHSCSQVLELIRAYRFEFLELLVCLLRRRINA